MSGTAAVATRSFVAIIAAYLLLLQSVLPGYAVPADAPGIAGSILCLTGDGSGQDRPGGAVPAHGSASCILCLAPSLAGGGDPARLALPLDRGLLLPERRAAPATLPSPHELDGIRPRGPPRLT